MKIFCLVLVMLFVLGGACVADVASIDVYDGWNLMALPLVPFNADPYEVMAGRAVDYALSRVDANGNYYILGIDDFGSMLLGDGFWYSNYEGAGQINYQGVADAVPGADGPTDMWISLPGAKEEPNVDEGGWHTIGCPFQHDVPIDNIYFTDGTQMLHWYDAITEGWVDFQMWYSGDMLSFNAYMYGDDDMMRQGKGYLLKTGVDDLAMILKN